MATLISNFAVGLQLKHRSFDAGLSRSQKRLANFGNSVHSVSRGVVPMGSNLDRTAKSTSGASRAVSSLVGGMKTLAPLAAAGAFAQLAKGGEEFNQKMRQSLAIMGDVGPEMRKQMNKTAFDVAKNTRTGATEAAESYFFLASAGLDAQQSVAAMPQVAQFAQAGMFDMARATDLLTDAQSALGLSVKNPTQNLRNMTRVSDVLVKANTLANASVSQFSESLTNKAGAALKVLNKDLEEGVAVLAAFADQGIKGAEGGTALNILLRDLSTKAIRNQKAFKQMGVAVFDAQGNMNNIGDIIGDLETALGGMSDQQQKATLLQLGFTDKSVAFTQALLGSSDAIKQYETDLRNAKGTTKDVADKQLTSFQKGLNKLTGTLAEVGASLSSTFGPALGAALSGLATTVDFIARSFKFLGVLAKSFVASLLRIAGIFSEDLANVGRELQNIANQDFMEGVEGVTPGGDDKQTGPSAMAAENTNKMATAAERATKAFAQMGQSNQGIAKTADEINSLSEALAAIRRLDESQSLSDSDLFKLQAAARAKFSGVRDLMMDMSKELAIAKGEATEFDFKLQEMARKGALPQQIEQARALRTELERVREENEKRQEKERQKQQKRQGLEQDAERVRESLKTPADKIREEFEKLKTLRSKGLLTGEEFKRARAQLFADATDIGLSKLKKREEALRGQLAERAPEFQNVGAQTAGSAEVFGSLVRQSFEGKAQATQTDLLKKINANLEKQEELQRQQTRFQKQAKGVKVASIN